MTLMDVVADRGSETPEMQARRICPDAMAEWDWWRGRVANPIASGLHWVVVDGKGSPVVATWLPAFLLHPWRLDGRTWSAQAARERFTYLGQAVPPAEKPAEMTLARAISVNQRMFTVYMKAEMPEVTKAGEPWPDMTDITAREATECGDVIREHERRWAAAHPNKPCTISAIVEPTRAAYWLGVGLVMAAREAGAGQ